MSASAALASCGGDDALSRAGKTNQIEKKALFTSGVYASRSCFGNQVKFCKNINDYIKKDCPKENSLYQSRNRNRELK